MKDTSGIGQLGENIAEDFLRKKGYKILDRNYKNFSGRRIGEIDIIARDQKEKEIVFVEVKTRDASYLATPPEENINRQKLRKLSKIADNYIRQNDLWNEKYRFDAISVWLDRVSRKARIKHIKSMFL